MEGKKLRPWRYGDSREELISVILFLLYNCFPFDFLEFSKEDEARNDVRWDDVKVAEEFRKELCDVCEGIAVSR